MKKLNEEGYLDLSYKSDIYALAGVFYSVITGDNNSKQESVYEEFLEKKNYLKISETNSDWETVEEEDYLSEEETILKKKLIETRTIYKDFTSNLEKIKKEAKKKQKENEKWEIPEKMEILNIFEKMLKKMTKENPKQRPTIDQVIIDILKGLEKIETLIEQKQNKYIENKNIISYKKYLEKEIESYYEIGHDFFKKNRDIIMDSTLKRERIYKLFMTREYANDLREFPPSVVEYFKPKDSLVNYIV